MAKCGFCGKYLPISEPPYQRTYFDKEKGKYVPSTSMICMCDKEQFRFMVMGAANYLNKRKRLPLFTDKELEKLYDKELWREVNKSDEGKACGEYTI